MTELSTQQWHDRYLQQARWTASLRQYLFQKNRVENARRVLEVGCGTGAILRELEYQFTNTRSVGLDIAMQNLREARVHALSARLICGDAGVLPFADKSFDVVCCHFVCLWLQSPQQAVNEMARVTRPGGCILALAEPDYGGRIDHPASFEPLGEMQAQALQRQGADPTAGRKLAGWFSKAGLQSIEHGILGAQWHSQMSLDDWQAEWLVLESDLSAKLAPHEFQRFKELDWAARQMGERVLFVPTFYAVGYVPG